jgi:hydrogenase maturation protein HypF
VLKAIISDLSTGTPASVMSGRFHQAVAQMIYQLVCRLGEMTGLKAVVLSGGVFQNMTLLTETLHLLANTGLEVYIPQKLPANDGGIAPGQALIAAARMKHV